MVIGVDGIVLVEKRVFLVVVEGVITLVAEEAGVFGAEVVSDCYAFCGVNIAHPALAPAYLRLESLQWVRVLVLVVTLINKSYVSHRHDVLAVSLVAVEIGCADAEGEVCEGGVLHINRNKGPQSGLDKSRIICSPVNNCLAVINRIELAHVVIKRVFEKEICGILLGARWGLVNVVREAINSVTKHR